MFDCIPSSPKCHGIHDRSSNFTNLESDRDITDRERAWAGKMSKGTIRLTFPITPKAKQSFRMGKHGYQSKAVTDYQKAIKAMALAQTSQDMRSLSGMTCMCQ